MVHTQSPIHSYFNVLLAYFSVMCYLYHSYHIVYIFHVLITLLLNNFTSCWMLTTTLQNKQQDTHITDGESEAWEGLVSCQGHTACAAWGCHSNSDCSSFKACVFHWKDCQVKVSRSLPSCFYPCVNLRIISFHLRVIFTKCICFQYMWDLSSKWLYILRGQGVSCDSFYLKCHTQT